MTDAGDKTVLCLINLKVLARKMQVTCLDSVFQNFSQKFQSKQGRVLNAGNQNMADFQKLSLAC